MNHRERIMAALSHEEPDRCPMQISFTPEFSTRLEADMALGSGKQHNPHGGGNTYALEIALDQDMLLTSVGWANSYYQESERYTDEWGIGWRQVAYDTPYGQGQYTEMETHPLADDRALESYAPPDPYRPELYTEAARMIENFKDDYWIVGVTVTTIFECAWALRGYDRLLMDFAMNPELSERILEIPYRYHLAAACKLVEMGVDMIWIGDDVGMQNKMLISPKHWRQYLKPRLANYIATLKNINPQIKIAYHSDGNIYPIIPELIDIGLDILNPIQPASMDPLRLKKDFGEKLCFWGTIDEQYTLPFGSPEEVRQEVLTRLRTVGKNGGLILGPTHHVQLDTPLENFWAMVETIRNTPYRDL